MRLGEKVKSIALCAKRLKVKDKVFALNFSPFDLLTLPSHAPHTGP